MSEIGDKMKDYATESDIIETADPLFYPGDIVKNPGPYGPMSLQVRDCAWDALYKTWTYSLVRFTMSEGGVIPTWARSVVHGSVPEKDLKLFLASKARHLAIMRARHPRK